MSISIAQHILTATVQITIAFSVIVFASAFYHRYIASTPAAAIQSTVHDKELIEASEWEYSPLESIPFVQYEEVEYIAPVETIVSAVYTKKRLMEIAKERKIKGRSTMSHAELMDILDLAN